ncbi:MAG: LptF/LptG family permease [Bacteroidia bacterium]|nr:LptF/LptG family permease [Bacteroidia bacterium]
MKRIDWLTLRSLIGPFIMSFAIILFILVIQFMSLYMNEIFGKGLGGEVLLKLFYYAGGRLAITALPVAILAAALMTFGNMGENNELAAMKSCGISLLKIMRASVVFGILLTGLSLWFSLDTVPRANLKFFSLLYDVQRKKPNVAIQPGHFYSDIDGYVIRATDKNDETGTLYDVLIYNHTDNRGNVDVIIADSAISGMDGNVMKMILYKGSRHEEYKNESGEPESYPLGRTYFDSLYYRFDLSGFDLDRTDESQFRHQITLPYPMLVAALDSLVELEKSYTEKSFEQIARYNFVDTSFLDYYRDTTGESKYEILESMTLEPEDNLATCFPNNTPTDLYNRALVSMRAVKSYTEFMVKKKDDQDQVNRNYNYEFHLRYALPFNGLLFMLIGVALGAIIRKGGLGFPSLISITLFMIFYILTTYGKKFAKEGVLEPWAGAWLSVMIFTPVALYLTYQATTDSKLLDESLRMRLKEQIIHFLKSIRQRKPIDH